MKEGLSALLEIGRKIHLLSHVNALIEWDQEVNMPPKALEERAEQISYIEGLIYDASTSTEMGAALKEMGASEETHRGGSNLNDIESAYVRVLYKLYRKQIKLPKDLVVEIAKQASIAQNKWVEARKNNDFDLFKPHLSRLLELTVEKTEKLGYEDHPYDALLDDFEPGTKMKDIQPVFSKLRTGLKEIIDKIKDADQIDNSFLSGSFPVEKQEQFGRQVVRDMGYDFERGRLDVSVHPFTTTLGMDDVRITTRYSEQFFNTGIFGIIHEAGHALYELGFSKDIRGNVLAAGTSLGIHESQSRMWENMIGRSYPFWEGYYPRIVELFPDALGDIPLDRFYRGINTVEPSLIRVEADEVTYNMHIILRFELECALLTGDLSVDNLPDAWNSTFSELLGISPATHAEGVLQDIHWSMGAFGYFPTYALGNLYAAQFFAVLQDRFPDIHGIIRNGEFTKIASWLVQNIHAYGSTYTAEEICRKVTGETLSSGPFLQYLQGKFGTIYALPGD